MRALRWRALLVLLLLAAAGAAIMPWAFHIGGRWTPVLTWWGSGRLVTTAGAEYPMFVMLYPASHFSRLRLAGVRPTGGIQGNACLCTSSGTFQYLKFSGTLYGGWQSTDGSTVDVRFLERTIIDIGQPRAGYFDLVGKWKGPDLVLEERANYSHPFRSGLKIDHASVTLRWNPYWTCKSACANAPSRGD